MKYLIVLITAFIFNIPTMAQIKHDALELPDFDSLWNYDNPGETEQTFRNILPQAESSGDTSYLIQLLTQIARTEGLQMKFDDAHKTLDRAKELEPEKYDIANIRYLLERGRVYNSSKVKDKAKELFLEAFNYGKNNTSPEHKPDFYTIDAAHMMGIVEQGDESLKWNETAIKLAEESTDEKSKKWLSSLCNNTGWTYFDMGQYDKALELFRKNVVWHTERNSKMPLIIAKWCVARTFRALNQVDEALNMQLDLVDELKEKGLEPDGYVFEEIGECLYLKGKNEDAKPYFKQAYEILSKDIWLPENEKERLARLKELSE